MLACHSTFSPGKPLFPSSPYRVYEEEAQMSSRVIKVFQHGEKIKDEQRLRGRQQSFLRSMLLKMTLGALSEVGPWTKAANGCLEKKLG